MQKLRDLLQHHPQWERHGLCVVLAVLIYLILLAIGRWLKRRMELPLGFAYQTSAAAGGLYLATGLIEPDLAWRREFAALAVLAGVRALQPLLNRILLLRSADGGQSDGLPKFLREVLSLFIFIVAVLLVLQVGYHIQIPGLIAGSGIAALAIGLAAQDLLGNIIGGFTLHFARPFRVHDWILLDGQHVQVIEINWRSTRFRNNDNTRLDVPNSHIVKQTIINYHGHDHRANDPMTPHAMRLEVGIDYQAPPNRVKDLLVSATADVPRVLRHPAPDIFLKSFGDSSIIYEVRYWIDDHAEHQRVSESIRTNIWYVLRRNAIKIPFPVRTLQVERRTPVETKRHGHRHDAFHAMLRTQPVFAAISHDDLDYLLETGEARLFGGGERIIEENAAGDSMFVITSGRAAVIIGGVGAAPSQVAELGVGECFGEMSMLTGEPRSATVQAIGDCEVLEITKPLFGIIMERDESLVSRLSELLVQRKLDTEGFATRLRDQASGAAGSRMAATAKEKEYRAKLLKKIRSFFEL
jgi:small-conductance mechanosensitive channel/CRP-like cAMP-binding protein